MNIEMRRGEAVVVRSYLEWVQKHARYFVITGLLIFVFAWGILLATGNYRLCVTRADDSWLPTGISIVEAMK